MTRLLSLDEFWNITNDIVYPVYVTFYLFLNRDRDTGQVSAHHILYAGCVYFLCYWIHAAAADCVFYQRLALTADGSHCSWLVLYSSVVVSFLLLSPGNIH